MNLKLVLSIEARSMKLVGVDFPSEAVEVNYETVEGSFDLSLGRRRICVDGAGLNKEYHENALLARGSPIHGSSAEAGEAAWPPDPGCAAPLR
jgi:hypothetical protein